MGNCYFMDHIAEDHTHTDITCTIEESQQKCRLGTVGNRLLGGGGGGGGLHADQMFRTTGEAEG